MSIVTYNTWADTSACVDAILASELPREWKLEIRIHDNGAEPPPSGQEPLSDRRVHVVRSPDNIGFGQGHNANLKLSRGKMFLILNPDARPLSRAIAVLARKLLTGPAIGAVAPQLRHEDGSIQASCRRLPRPRYELLRVLGLDRLRFPPFSYPLMAEWDHDTERVVEQPAGAALMMRSSDLRRIGGFADEFPMYFEDVDLCRRVGELLGPVLFTPEAQVLHTREATARRYRKETTFWLAWSRNTYYKRAGFSAPIRLAVWVLGLITALTRMVVLGCLGLLAPSHPRGREARDKAAGYALFLCTPILSDEGHWRRALLHR